MGKLDSYFLPYPRTDFYFNLSPAAPDSIGTQVRIPIEKKKGCVPNV